jgi:hypothetical protein
LKASHGTKSPDGRITALAAQQARGPRSREAGGAGEEAQPHPADSGSTRQEDCRVGTGDGTWRRRTERAEALIEIQKTRGFAGSAAGRRALLIATVTDVPPKRQTPPPQTWRTFLANHVRDLVPIDFFTVPTACFRVLFALVVLAHQRRRVLLFNVTERPTAPWTAQQIVDAFPDDSAPSYLLRDRDTVYGERSVRMRRLISSPSSVRIAIWLRGRPPEARCRDSPPTPTSRAGIRREVAGTSSRTRPGSAMWSSS